MSDDVDDDVVPVDLGYHHGKFHVMTPACTCAIGIYASSDRIASAYHVPTGCLTRTDRIELLEKWVCGTCRRSLKVWIRNTRERARFKRWRIETGTLAYITPQDLKRYRQWRREQEAEKAPCQGASSGLARRAALVPVGRNDLPRAVMVACVPPARRNETFE